MNNAKASAEAGHIRDRVRTRLAVALLAVSVVCGTPAVAAQATQATPMQSPRPSSCAPEADTARSGVQGKPALKDPTHEDALDSKPCPATSKAHPADDRARDLLLLLGILQTPRHGT